MERETETTIAPELMCELSRQKLSDAETRMGVLVFNLKELKKELEDRQAKENFYHQQLKEKGMPSDTKGQAEYQAKFFTHLCTANAYGLLAKDIEIVLAKSGVRDGV